MKKFILGAVILFLLNPAWAFKEVDEVAKKYQKSENWRMEFVQQTYIESVSHVIQRVGHLSVSPPHEFVLTYTDKPQKKYSYKNNKLEVYDADSQNTEVFERADEVLSPEVRDMLMGFKEVSIFFTVQLATAQQLKVLPLPMPCHEVYALTPKNPESQILQMFVCFTKEHNIQSVLIKNLSNNFTRYDFKSPA